jgi:P4 family phage/plasmid primase-like protien
MGEEGYKLTITRKWIPEFKIPMQKILFKNGVLDLKTRDLESFDPRYHLTTSLPYDYSKSTSFDWKTCTGGCPLFLFALQQILPKVNDRMRVLQYIRYSLSKSIRHGFAQLWIGEGSNGKTSLMEFFADILGDLAVAFSMESFAEERGYITNIKEKNLAICSEIGGAYLSVKAQERLKEMVTDKYLNGRAAYGRQMHWQNTTKSIYGTNTMPRLEKRPKMAFWRRWDLIFFNQCFDGIEDKTLFEDILKYEGGAVLSYILREVDFDEMTHTPWKEVRDYWMNACSTVIRFIEEECVRDPDIKTLTRDLYSSYSIYMNTTEPEEEIVSDKVFHNEMRRIGFIKTKSTDNQTYFRGIRVDYRSDEDKEAQMHVDRLTTASLDSDCEYKQRSYQERQAEIKATKAAKTKARLEQLPGYEPIESKGMSDTEIDNLLDKEEFYND